MTDKQKPSIEIIVDAFKRKIPGCGISDSEIEAFKEIYPYVTYDQVGKVFHSAINQKAMQPFSYMTRKLQVIQPPASDPFKYNPQVSRYNGKRRVEVGTDWKAKNAEIQAKKDAERQAYDRVHGAGAYDAELKASTADLAEKFRHLDNYLGYK